MTDSDTPSAPPSADDLRADFATRMRADDVERAMTIANDAVRRARAWIEGPNAGRAGTIVWIGASRFGAGRRLGIEPAKGDVFFASEDAVRDVLMTRKPARS